MLSSNHISKNMVSMHFELSWIVQEKWLYIGCFYISFGNELSKISGCKSKLDFEK